jgi:sodium-dependent dicarboxylate transporter 2/3/5
LARYVSASGYLSRREIINAGALIMAVSWLLFLGSAHFVWPLIGLQL